MSNLRKARPACRLPGHPGGLVAGFVILFFQTPPTGRAFNHPHWRWNNGMKGVGQVLYYATPSS